jgi:hypothetical protein
MARLIGIELLLAASKPCKQEEAVMEKFTITTLPGWKQEILPNGVRIFKPSGEFLQIQVIPNSISEEEDKSLLQELADKYNGTPLKQVQMFGIVFYATNYTAYGKELAYCSAIRNREQVKIQTSGKCYEDNDEIKTMLESIAFVY